MEWVVTTGRTIEEAKDAALDELGVDEQDAEFEILEEPRLGLFGRQRGEARVRARVRPNVPRPKTDRRDRRRRKPDGASQGGESAERADREERAGPAERAPDRGRSGRGERPAKVAGGGAARRSRGGPAPAAPAGVSSSAGSAGSVGEEADAGGDGAAGGPPAEGDGPTDGPARSSSRRRRGGRRSGARPVVVEGDRADEDEGDGFEDGGMMGEQELDLAQQAEVAETFVRGLLERFSLPAETTTETVDEETFEVQVTGPELGLLIGPKGQTLQAVQELTRTAVQRRASNRTGRILVDVAGYRVRRREALERFTRQVADDVRSSGVQRVLEPMNPADRKVVHDTANTIEGVRTSSEGEEPHRRVVILPDTAAGTDDETADETGDEAADDTAAETAAEADGDTGGLDEAPAAEA